MKGGVMTWFFLSEMIGDVRSTRCRRPSQQLGPLTAESSLGAIWVRLADV
jgi:hypothetical protein